MSAYGEMAFGGLVNAGMGIISNYLARQREAEARLENYKYGELAANSADARTRALYEDYQSPEALLRQYKEAGLSPSLMFSNGAAGAGGMTQGAQGAGAAGISPNVFGLNVMEGAQLGLLKAQTEKTKAEARNIDKDTDIKTLQEEWQTMVNADKFQEWRIFSSYNEDGTSLYDKATKYKDFNGFLNWYKDQNGGAVNEYERKALQKIYTASYYVDREIAVLTNETVSAEFYQSVTKALKNEDFANWNAQSTVQYLKQNVEVNKLTEKQHHAWNNLLERLEKRNDTAAQILLVVGMIIDKALTQYRLPTIQTGGQTFNINNAAQ